MTETVGAARTAALDWVQTQGRSYPGYIGAYFGGSSVGLPSDSEVPLGSDIDIYLITKHEVTALKLGKFLHQGVLLEVASLSWREIFPAETALMSYHLAGGLRVNSIIDDPRGLIADLQAIVAAKFSNEFWVRQRCDNVLRKITAGLASLDETAPLHDLVMSWIFPAGITAHLLLVAALQNPTVRLRHLRLRSVLERYKHEDWYVDFLSLIGCESISAERAEHHVRDLARTFDTAVSVSKTPFSFSTDISKIARPIAIDASLDLIAHGFHRETTFWTFVTFARCHKILAVDAPSLGKELQIEFKNALTDIGIQSPPDISKKANRAIKFIPRLESMRETILAENSDIVR